MGLLLTTLLGSIFLIFLLIFFWARNHYSYWSRKGVKHPKPSYFLGNTKLLKLAPGQLYTELYRKYSREKYLGVYEMRHLRLLLIDPSIIQKILIKDFSHFMDRGSSFNISNNKNNDGGIFFMTGSKWRSVRNKLSPTFTSGKLKNMLEIMLECCNNLENEISMKNGELEAREFMFSYTIDIIASCAFGLDIHNDKDSASEFRKMGLKALNMNFPKLILMMILSNFPFLLKIINAPFLDKETTMYFGNVLTQALKFRRQTGYSRNDFLQLLIQLKEKGTVEYHGIDPEDEYLDIQKSSINETYEFTEHQLMAQAFTFITAGIEPPGNTLTFVIAELAHREDIQIRVRNEVKMVLEKHENKFTYQALQEMEFLENCILETLRLYPVGKLVRRVCTKQYNLDDGITIDVGTTVVVPSKAIHLDPRYFSNPLDFNPDRFKESILPCTFFPFGDGPRICIGMRFAMVEMKVCLAKLINNYKLKPAENFTYPIPLNKWSFFSVTSKPVPIKFQRIIS